MSIGVNVTSSTRSAPSTNQLAAGATYFAAGITERGDTSITTKVTSLSDFERLFGGYVSYGSLHQDIRTFFEEGGGSAYIGRVVGPTPVVASLTLVDKAGSPVSTLRIDAFGPGAWAQGVTIGVAAGDLSGTFKITVSYSGAGAQAPEVYNNLVTPADAVRQMSNSAYVRATDLGSSTAAPNNQPANISPAALSGGTDDRSNITTAQYTAALNLFLSGLGSGVVAIPGQPASSVGSILRDHAVANNRIAFTAPSSGQTVNQAISAVGSLVSTLAGNGAEYVGMIYPWIKIPDPSINGVTRTISPEGYAAACRARANEAGGPVVAPAGDISIARFVVDTEKHLVQADIDSLNAAKVSPIAIIGGNIELYGYRSLSTDDANYHWLTARDVVNYVSVDAKDAVEQFVFRVIDGNGRLFSDMNAALTGRLELLKSSDQFYVNEVNGQLIDPGYRVDTGSSVNTPTTIAQNKAKALISIRPAPSAEEIDIEVAKVAVGGSV